MARCSYHPDVETELSCTECGKPICPKEMVLTPVGYKCPEHARAARGQYTYVKPHQLLRSILVGIAVGAVGGLFLGFVGFGGILLGVLWGSLTAEAVRRASGGHRGGIIGAVAVMSIGVGWLVAYFLGGLSPLMAIVAIVVALIQLAVIQFRT